MRTIRRPPRCLDACDELGVYVIDEAFDAWREGKRPFDEHIFFETDWQDEITNMVTRDRNHPSVILWSTGNEIYGAQRCVRRRGMGASASRRCACVG